jgi:RNase P subunit RPR2
MELQAYCVKCKTMRNVKDAKVTTTKNGRNMVRGKCATCGTSVCKFVSSKKT